MSTGIIILVATLAVFAAMAVWAIVASRQWDWPEGQRVDGEYKGYKVTLIYGKDVKFAYPDRMVANACACAAWALGDSWTKIRTAGTPSAKVLRWCVVHVLSDADYDRLYDGKIQKAFPYLRNMRSNGMLISMSKKLGRGNVPIAACRHAAFGSTVSHGSLVIHELIHFLMAEHDGKNDIVGHDYQHESSVFWHGRSERPLELMAQEQYLAHKGEVGIKV